MTLDGIILRETTQFSARIIRQVKIIMVQVFLLIINVGQNNNENLQRTAFNFILG